MVCGFSVETAERFWGDGIILHLEKHWYPEHWDMDINLGYICSTEGKKEKVQIESGVWKKMPVIPKSQINKIFKFILKNATDEQIEQVQEYLNKHSKTYGQIFKKFRGGE